MQVWHATRKQLGLHFGGDLYFALKPFALNALVQERFDVGRHIVKRPGQLAQLIVRGHANAMRKISALDKLRRTVKLMHSASDGARHPHSRNQRQHFKDEKGDGDDGERSAPGLSGSAAS